MKRNAMGAIALAATFAGVAASANTLTAFGTYTFDDDETGAIGASVTGGAWAVTAGDIAEVTTDKKVGDSGKSLLIDAESEVRFTPTANNTDTISLDVYLTPLTAGDPPTVPADAKLVVYLEADGTLKGATGGSDEFSTIKSGVTPNTWVTLKLAFDGSHVTVSVNDEAGDPIASSATTVTSVGFKGTGYIDNFTGTYEYNYAYDNNGGADAAASKATIGVDGKTVTFNYAGTDHANDIKFVRVYDAAGNYVTLRVNGNSGTIDASKLPGDVTKVVAFYGESVSAAPDAAPAVASATVDQSGVTVALGYALSGVTYSAVDTNGNDIPGATVKVGGTTVSGAVPPEKDGEAISVTVPASTTAFGSVKFKVQVAD